MSNSLLVRTLPGGVHAHRGVAHPDGVWHDWLEDSVAFIVSDSRYTAGVANLHAQVSLLKRS